MNNIIYKGIFNIMVKKERKEGKEERRKEGRKKGRKMGLCFPELLAKVLNLKRNCLAEKGFSEWVLFQTKLWFLSLRGGNNDSYLTERLKEVWHIGGV